jgi:U3 small nucleolar RNA-associated protein 22
LSEYQLFRLVLGVIGKTPWQTHKIVFGAENPIEGKDDNWEACVLTEDQSYNVFWRVSIAGVAYDARRSLSMLDAMDDPFLPLFGTKFHLDLVYDIVLVLDPPKTCHALDEIMQYGRKVAKVLANGLGKRLERMDIRTSRRGQSQPGVSLLLRVNQLEQSVVLERGPAGDTPEGTEFRKFWGEKSELRRFKDGSVSEAVVWREDEDKLFEVPQSVVPQILRHLLKQHFGLDFDSLLQGASKKRKAAGAEPHAGAACLCAPLGLAAQARRLH